MSTFKIGDFTVGEYLRPYIIAEIGVNHEGDFELAKRLIDEAKRGGAHAAKFQTYKAEKIAAKHSPAYWDQSKEPTESQYKLFKKFDGFGVDEYAQLAEYCQSVEIDFMSTPFDLEAVDALLPLMSAVKIASADITNVPLIRKCAASGKPLIMSTGAASYAEIDFAVRTAKAAGAKAISLLHCVLNYPTPEAHAQLNVIRDLQRVFPDCVIGYSDHVVPDETISALEVASLMGALILEKHFTHDKSLPGNDHYHAMNECDLLRFNEKLNTYHTLAYIGKDTLGHQQAARMHARRSIVTNGPIKKGDTLTEDNLIAKRPAHGISPIHWDDVLGAKAVIDMEDDTIIQWRDIE